MPEFTKEDLILSKFSLDSLVQDTIELYQSQLENKNITLTYTNNVWQ